jgi:hypothetical protein
MAKYASLDVLEEASELDTQHKRQVYLSWNIIRFKLMHYHPELVDEEFKKPLSISDERYEKLKTEYLGLCMKLGVDNHILDPMAKPGSIVVPGSGMKEIDFDRPAVISTLNYVGIDEWKDAVAQIKEKAKANTKPVEKGLPEVDTRTDAQKKEDELLDAYDERMGWGM